MRAAAISILLASLVLGGAARAQSSREVREGARVIATAGVAGRFGEPRCHEETLLAPHEITGFTGPLVRRGADALVLDTGGLLAPHGVMRFANSEIPDAVATLVSALGYQALAFGEADLGAPRERTLRVALSLRVAGLDYIASNLRCEPTNPLCDVVRDIDDLPLPIDAGIERAAVLSFLDPDALGRVAPDRSEGLSIEPIADQLPIAVRVARAAGATLVIAVLEVDSPEAFAIARGLPEDGRPDLVLLAEGGADLLFARPATVVPAIVAPPPGSGVEVAVGRSDRFAAGFELLATPLTEPWVAPAVQTFLGVAGPRYCERWGTALPGGHLERPIDGEGMAALTASVVREHAGADVALFNVEAIDGEFEPADPTQLSASDLYLAIPYDEPLMVADVPASWLRLAYDRAASHRLLTTGLRSEEGTTVEALRIRGRAPVSGAMYRVVTLRFLAEGGDDALPPLPGGTRWEAMTHDTDGERRADTLRDVMLSALAVADGRDVRDARPSPAETPEWVLRGTVDGSFSGSTVENAAGYTAAQLSTIPSLAMGILIDIQGNATAPDWSWENRVMGNFRTQWAPSPGPGVAGTFIEAQDQLQIRSLGSYRGFRSDPTAVYIPDLYVEAFVESEISRPDTRDFHWLLLRPTVGTRFPLLPEFEIKLQVGLQAQLLQTGAEAEFGAGGSLLLNRWTVFTDDVRSLTAEGSADFFCADLFDQNRWQLRSNVRIALDLAGPLALTFGATLYMQEESAMGVSLAFSATAGLRIAAVTRAIGP